MLKAAYTHYRLEFNFQALTSRGALPHKDTYYIKVWDDSTPERYGIGECALFKGLSSDDRPNYEETLSHLCHCINNGTQCDISKWSSIRFGLETALLDFENGCSRLPFPSEFTEGKGSVDINGLVWMGTLEQMAERAEQKIREGFRCIKFKIGGTDFNEELRLLDMIRLQHGPDELEIRVDANGAFKPDDALEKLKRLSVLDIHSIEQPIAAGHWEEMSFLCENSPVAIALDEELIGINAPEEMHKMLYYIHPAYIILKPALCGGFSGATDWINNAESKGIGWWVTSALESNIGLNAIAQWTAAMNVKIPQGLGTGALYTNNFVSPLTLKGDKMTYNPAKGWDISTLQWIIPQ